MTIFIDILIVVLGLIVGSFLNVVVQRLPQDESVVCPARSKCPKCSKSITWRDNIPVLSFLILQGRCRYCRQKISFRYPLVEILSAVIWYVSWKTWGLSPGFGVQIIFLSLLLAATMTDLETELIPDEITIGGMAVGLLASFVWPPIQQTPFALAGILRSVLGLLIGGGLVYLTGLAGNFIFQKELTRLGLDQSMGGGDVKFLAMAGTFLGWENVLLAFFTAPFFGLPFALYLKLAKKERVIPYGPFLSLACLVQFFYGDVLWNWFFGI